ncbi:hypothetical protein BJ508DRAFT_40171 [Ascobolus immersus RN42]|uniref:Uncharacterized protein n=1 Tax=Ascobolus immersus RN42 TaxID=1160509 RepID=A0A3N4HLH9_ASCIM|nr:hypothetical protein BJ508DRAFT_40171 [Ascobolus immersus RN42]
MLLTSERCHEAERLLKEFLLPCSSNSQDVIRKARLAEVYAALDSIRAADSLGFMGTGLTMEELVTTSSKSEWQNNSTGSFVDCLSTYARRDTISFEQLLDRCLKLNRHDIILACYAFLPVTQKLDHPAKQILPRYICKSATTAKTTDSLKPAIILLKRHPDLLLPTLLELQLAKLASADISHSTLLKTALHPRRRYHCRRISSVLWHR